MMLTVRIPLRSALWWLVVAGAVMVLTSGARAQSESEEEGPPFRQVYLDHADRQFAGIQADVSNQRILLNERGQEFLEEIAVRVDEELARVPSYVPLPGEQPPPEHPSVLRLNEYETTLSEQVYEIENRMLDAMDQISLQRDSLVSELKQPEDVRRIIDELEKAIRTDLELWRTKVDFVGGRLIADGTPDQARRMFVRSYNSIVLHYQIGQYRLALDRIELLGKPYGDLPLPEWLESLPFYRAECLYALGEWDEAFEAYMGIWQEQTHLYAQQALLDWVELALAGQEYRQLATMWVTQPRLPDDPIDANRIRLLVAESYLRLNEPQTALAVLDQLAQERPVLDAERDVLTPEDIAYLQQANTRLLVYGQLLRAEADLSNVPERNLEEDLALSRAETQPSADLEALLGTMPTGTATSGVGTTPSHLDTTRYYSAKAFLIAEGKIRSTKARRDEALKQAIADLEGLLTVVRQIDRDGPLVARTLMALGQAYFQDERYGDAAAAYGAVPMSSVWYPDAQLGRAWAFLEQGNYLEAKTSINIARRWPLSPSAALEASALNSYILSQLGDEQQANAEVQNMMVAVTFEERRGASVWMVRQLQQIDQSLRLLGILSLERQNEGLYRAVREEREHLDSLRVLVQQVEQYLRQYSLGKLSDRGPLTQDIRREQGRLRTIQEHITDMRRQAGRAPTEGGAGPQLSFEERRHELERWLRGVEPSEVSAEQQVYEAWVEYAEFAYAKRIFEENQQRRTQSEDLRNMRYRISRIISDSP